MLTKNLKNATRTGFLACALLTSLTVPLSAHAAVDRTSSIQASGEGIIYDIRATGNGTLRVCTRAGRTGDRWRASIVQVTTDGAVSAVGTGSSTVFTGCISRTVTSGTQYIALVTWDRPLPGTFPATVTTRFTGTTDASNPPVVGVDGATLANILPRNREGGPCPADGSLIIGGALLTNCQFNPSGDTDTFRFSAPANGAASIKISGPSGSQWTLFAPGGSVVGFTSSGMDVRKFATTGIYTIQTKNAFNSVGSYSLSMNGVSAAFREGGEPINFTQTFQRTLDAAADQDTFNFSCSANQVVSVTITGPSGTQWSLFNPTGDQVGFTSSGTAQATCTTNGLYTIRVHNAFNSTGVYGLTLQSVSGS
jgi:hypothetical protein